MKVCPQCGRQVGENLLSCNNCGNWLVGEEPQKKIPLRRRLWPAVAENYLLLLMVLAWVMLLYILVKPIFQTIFTHPLGPFLILVGASVLSLIALYRQLIMK
ncbi:MAG: hypothetical protein FJ134_12420 [Deltaproteobacteria bacterium]|nr:hypothetical protein [Deltaproteobacteria bacterium]